MAGQVNWYGDEIQAKIKAEMGRRLDACRIATQNYAKKLIAQEGASGSGNTRLYYNTNPSSPGNPPHTQTGRLKGSVASERTDMVARVGTNVEYGRMLELGTTRMAARPWLRRSLNAMTPFIRNVLSRPMKGG